jgi:hypothetical protein
MECYRVTLISLGLIPRSFASIFLTTDSQTKKEY